MEEFVFIGTSVSNLSKVLRQKAYFINKSKISNFEIALFCDLLQSFFIFIRYFNYYNNYLEIKQIRKLINLIF